MYSPGVAKVTLTVALPLTLPVGRLGVLSTSSFGFALSNFTSPGPRYFDHVSASGGGGTNSGGVAASPRPPPRPPRPAASPRPAAASPVPPRAASPPRPRPRPRPRPSGMLIFGPSSLAHTVIASGVPAVAVYFSALPFGAPAAVSPPLSLNLNVGGVFLLAASSSGSTT